MFLGKLFIIVSTCVLSYLMLVYIDVFAEDIATAYGPVFVCGIIAYAIASVYMSVFSFSSDTIMQCFFLDEEMVEKAGRPADNRPPIM